MKLELEVTKVVLLTGKGPDKAVLTTTLPDTFPPMGNNEPAFFQMQFTSELGLDYLINTMGIEKEIIEEIDMGGKPPHFGEAIVSPDAIEEECYETKMYKPEYFYFDVKDAEEYDDVVSDEATIAVVITKWDYARRNIHNIEAYPDFKLELEYDEFVDGHYFFFKNKEAIQEELEALGYERKNIFGEKEHEALGLH